MAEKLSGKQAQALSALLTEATVEAAAGKAQVSQRTLYRWLSDPIFTGAYREARRKAVGQAIARLQHASADAVTALRSVMNDAEAPAPARVNAAKAVLELAVRVVELEDLETRVQELERAVIILPANGR
jgi:hypothetical protein